MDLPEHVSSRLGALAPGHGRVLVAVSGGGDSVALLAAAVDAGLSVAAGHLDHRLRGHESDEDARYVAGLTEDLGVNLVSEQVDVRRVAEGRRWNLEDAARRVRYEFLHRAAKAQGCDVIAVGHTLDDQAETLLLQALRGSALPAGMPERRGMVVRPVLDVSRERLRDYLIARGLGWREDASNRDASRARAWLRSEVMPVLARRHPGAAERLAATAMGLRDVKAALDAQATALLGEGDLDAKALVRAPVAVQRHAIARLMRASRVRVNRPLVERVLRAVERAAVPNAAPWRVSVGRGRYVVVAYGRVSVTTTEGRRLPEPLHVETVDDLISALARHGAAGSLTRAGAEELLGVHGRLTLRHRRAGDRVRVPAGTKKLSDLLIDRKVPRHVRDALLVLADGDRVLWAEGVPLVGGTAPSDEAHMRSALALAEEAATAGELPVGALVVAADGTVLAGASNGTERESDPTSHAELVALRAAGRASDDWRLEGGTLYVTLEPCPMCWGAVLQTRLARVVYGASNRHEGALGGVMDLRHGDWKRRPVVVPGVLERDAAALLQEFFARARSRPDA